MSTQARAASWRSVLAEIQPIPLVAAPTSRFWGASRGADHKPIISQGVVGVV